MDQETMEIHIRNQDHKIQQLEAGLRRALEGLNNIASHLGLEDRQMDRLDEYTNKITKEAFNNDMEIHD